MSDIFKISNEKLVIISLTSIAWITLIVMAICMLFEHLVGTEVISLFISIVSAVVGALSGIYVGRKINPNDNTLPDNTTSDDTTTINTEPTINTEENKQDNTNTENEQENLLEIQDKQ